MSSEIQKSRKHDSVRVLLLHIYMYVCVCIYTYIYTHTHTHICNTLLGFAGGTSGKEPICQCRRGNETWAWSLGLEDPLEEGMATHPGIVAWRISWTEEPGWLQSIGLQRVRCDQSDLAHTYNLWLDWPKSLFRFFYNILWKNVIFSLTQCNIYPIYTWLVLCLFYLKILSWALFALCHEICNFILVPCATMCPSPDAGHLSCFWFVTVTKSFVKKGHVEWKAGLELLEKGPAQSTLWPQLVFLWYATYIHFLPSEVAQSCPTLCDLMDSSLD